MGKKIGKGFDAMIPTESSEESYTKKEAKKEKLFCEIDADLKKQIQLYKVENRISISDIVENALKEYLNK